VLLGSGLSLEERQVLSTGGAFANIRYPTFSVRGGVNQLAPLRRFSLYVPVPERLITI